MAYYETCAYIKTCLHMYDDSIEDVVDVSFITNDLPCFIKKHAVKKTLEINIHHKLIQYIHNNFATKYTENFTRDIVLLMYNGSLIAQGFAMHKPNEFNHHVVKVLMRDMNLQEMIQNVESHMYNVVGSTLFDNTLK